MKTMASTISKVKQKLKQVKFRHLKAYLSDNLKADPRNCTHNEIRKSKNGVVHTCGYEGSSTYGKICDVSFDKNRAKECGLFCPKKNKEELKAEFYSFIDNSSIGEIAKEFPDVTALMWVLDTLGADESDTELKEHYERIEQLTVENHELANSLQDMKNISTLQTEEITRLDGDISVMTDKHFQVLAELKDTKADKEQLSEFIRDLQAENNALKEQIEQKIKREIQLTNTSDTLIRENDQLRSEIVSTQTALSFERNLSLWQRLVRWLK